jgi:signal transduction histidine kinase
MLPPVGFKILIPLVHILLLLNCDSFSQTPYLLADTASIHRLDKHIEIFIDPTDSISIDQVVSSSFQNRFQPSKSNLTFGYMKSSIWLKVKVKTIAPKLNWYLEIPAPFLEYVDFYQSSENGLHHSSSGYYRPQHVKDLSHTGHLLSLRFNTDSMATVYIRIAGRSPKTFPLYALEKERLNAKTRVEDLWYGIFFGILIVMFFYNFVIYLSIQQTNYLLYICTIVCTFLIFVSASGYAGKFLWPENPGLNYYSGRLTLGLITAFLSVFTIRFLEVRYYSRVMYYVLVSMVILSVLATILVATDTVSSAGNSLITISTIVYLTTGIVCSLKGNKTAIYFIAAWALYIIGGLLLTLRNSGVFDFNFWTTHFVEFGAMLETIVIAFALGDHYTRLRKEKEEAQLMTLKLRIEATDKLEIKVKERTEELSRTNEELHTTLETNKLQTKIIEDKNAELDAFFYRISHDLKGPISSLLGLSYLAKLDISDPRALEYIEKQHAQVERLNSIIRGLINLTKLNHAALQKEKIDFRRMIDDCILSFNAFPNFGRITFRKDIQEDLEFYTEWTLLNAILQNLIENAIKYSGEQSPYVRIAIHSFSKGITIEVEDNGQGISEEHQPKIFEMFYRATQNENGTGLGLYILKRSVDRLKGNIDISSKLGVGSIFTVNLPQMAEGV